MIIIDTKLAELEKTGTPIRVGLVGAGYAARGFITQLVNPTTVGMRLVAVANRTPEHAREALLQNKCTNIQVVEQAKDFQEALRHGLIGITTNHQLLIESTDIDVIVEATGSFEYAAQVIFSALSYKKHVVLINAELDATIGPILKVYADKKKVIYTQADGDQPGVLMNLYREVSGMGLTPVLAGNVKGLLDHYRNPETQISYAKEHGISPQIAASFADGTKISQEMATVANAMKFLVLARGMWGPTAKTFADSITLFPRSELLKQGVVDYLLNAQPAYGVFIIGFTDNKERQKYLKEYKMGNGPCYVFSRPYHLSPLEAPSSVARAFLFHDPTITPQTHACDVIAVTKRNLKTGETLDGSGGFCCYATIENTSEVLRQKLLPLGIAEGCKVIRDISKDTPLTFDDVEFPAGRLIDRLWKEQTIHFNNSIL